MHSADLPALDNLGGLRDVVRRPVLRAHLHDAFALAHRFDHGLGFAHTVDHGFLEINVFARFAGQNQHLRVPLVHGGDDDGVDGLVRQQLAEVVIGLGLWRPFPGVIHSEAVAVAQRHDVHVARFFQPRVQIPVVVVLVGHRLNVFRGAAHQARIECASATTPDETDIEPVVSAQHPAGGHGRPRCDAGSRRALQEVPSLHVIPFLDRNFDCGLRTRDHYTPRLRPLIPRVKL